MRLPAIQIGALAHDFGLPARGGAIRLGLATRRMAGQGQSLQALFPEGLIVEPGNSPDAVLALPRDRHSGRQIGPTVGRPPVLLLRPTLMRAPPVAGRIAAPYSTTLARVEAAGEVGWPALILRQAVGEAKGQDWFSPAVEHRAGLVLDRMRAARLGGTWWGREPRVSAGGKTVVFATGGPGESAVETRRMVDRALAGVGAARVVLVVARPDGCAEACRRAGVAVVHGVVDPWPLVEEAAEVIAAEGSDAAFLAALLGKSGAVPGRVAAAALLLGARYVDPYTGLAATCEQFLAHAEEWRRHAAGNAEIACCVGISRWKRRRVGAMLGAAGMPAFRSGAQAAVAEARRRGGAIAVWPSRQPAGLERLAAAAGVRLVRVEDGFVRSVGLGADFRPPLSIVLDRLGIYYDATGPSDLEAILSESRFDPAMLRRAAALRMRMVESGVTKYNLHGEHSPIRAPAGRVVVLVPGQVADDRSVLLGGAGARPGLDLLMRVRAQAPDAWIVYKPHPDVDAGYRAGALADGDVLRLADQVVRGGSMARLLDGVDAVHTLTSLTGFEALLRGKAVTTYGMPFYAGWGLTTDCAPVARGDDTPGRARRTRSLSLDALVAGAMILYPRYVDPVTLLPCGPETVLDRLVDPMLQKTLHRATALILARRLQGQIVRYLAGRPRRLLRSLISREDPV